MEMSSIISLKEAAKCAKTNISSLLDAGANGELKLSVFVEGIKGVWVPQIECLSSSSRKRKNQRINSISFEEFDHIGVVSIRERDMVIDLHQWAYGPYEYVEVYGFTAKGLWDLALDDIQSLIPIHNDNVIRIKKLKPNKFNQPAKESITDYGYYKIKERNEHPLITINDLHVDKNDLDNLKSDEEKIYKGFRLDTAQDISTVLKLCLDDLSKNDSARTNQDDFPTTNITETFRSIKLLCQRIAAINPTKYAQSTGLPMIGFSKETGDSGLVGLLKKSPEEKRKVLEFSSSTLERYIGKAVNS